MTSNSEASGLRPSRRRPRGPQSWRYSRWDGTQRFEDPDADDVLGGIADDLLYHGDLDAALRRVLQEGFTTAGGHRVQGLRELLSRLRRRREELARHDLGGLADEVVRELDEVLSIERRALEETLERAPAGPARQRAAEAQAELDLLPDSLAERLSALGRYEFSSAEAAQRFEDLVSKLRHDLAQLFLDRAAAASAQAGPAERAHLRDGLAALNEMLAQRARADKLDPSFEAFMERFGDLFPGASSLDELLEQLASRMAAASALLASMDAEQRAQLEQLSQELLSDLDLAWQIDQLGEHLRAALPGLAWDQPQPVGSGPAIGLGEAGDLYQELAELARLEQLLGSSLEPAALLEVDVDAAARLLGPDVASSLDALAKLTRRLEEAGLVDRREGRLQLTPKGLRRLGTRALGEIFGRLGRSRFGDHAIAQPGSGHERSGQTKPYEHGDPFQLDIQETIRNAIVRNAAEPSPSKQVLPVRLSAEDFVVEQAEHASTAATVLAIDLSLSMPMRDNFLAAKKVALALQALIASQYPRDYLGLVGFSATAREIRASELPEVSWDFAYGTNLQHALALSRRLLANRAGSKQIVLITDGEPTAHALEGGEVFFHYPPSFETIKATLLEVGRCTRAHITINSFVLDATGSLRAFVEEMTRRNKGRAFFTTPDRLGDYVLVDFVEHRRGAKRRRLRPA
jgi:uncharacterized protein with von Willebrand factor type A (vWA) domain